MEPDGFIPDIRNYSTPMLYDNEVVMLILGAGVAGFARLNYPHIKRIHSWKWLILSFYLMMGGWLFTILEGFFLEEIFNYLEHISYTLSGLVLAYWCRNILLHNQEAES
jgi:hypothetical protein